MKKVIAIALAVSMATPAFAGGHHFGRDVGPAIGLTFGLGVLALGAAALISENNRRTEYEYDRRCLIGYDNHGNKIYDIECMEYNR